MSQLDVLRAAISGDELPSSIDYLREARSVLSTLGKKMGVQFPADFVAYVDHFEAIHEAEPPIHPYLEIINPREFVEYEFSDALPDEGYIAIADWLIGSAFYLLRFRCGELEGVTCIENPGANIAPVLVAGTFTDFVQYLGRIDIKSFWPSDGPTTL